jgi:hypothetical protein
MLTGDQMAQSSKTVAKSASAAHAPATPEPQTSGVHVSENALCVLLLDNAQIQWRQ